MMNKKMLLLPIVLISVNIFGIIGEIDVATIPVYDPTPTVAKLKESVELFRYLIDVATTDNPVLRARLYDYYEEFLNIYIRKYEQILDDFDNRNVYLAELDLEIENLRTTFSESINEFTARLQEREGSTAMMQRAHRNFFEITRQFSHGPQQLNEDEIEAARILVVEILENLRFMLNEFTVN